MEKRKYVFLITGVLLLFTSLNAKSTIYTVNSTADPGTGAGTSGSLRYCITQANLSPGPHAINFTGMASGSTITLSSDLPAIIQPDVTIDATTVTGYVINATGITIDASVCTNGIFVNAAANFKIYGFQIYGADYGIRIEGDAADGFTIGALLKRNVINRCYYCQIYLIGADNGYIVNNHIGCDIAGTSGYYNPPETGAGIWIETNANNNTIGGTAPGEGNLLAGGTGCAVHIGDYFGSPADGSSGNIFYGNKIGGNGASLPWYCWAFWIDGNSDNNIIGGIAAGQGNDLTYATNGYCGNGYGNLVIGVNEVNADGNQIRNNNMDCAFGFGIRLVPNPSGGNNNQAEPTITGLAGNILSGTSSPNAAIDIYKGSLCNDVYGECKGADYITSTIANPGGNWSINMGPYSAFNGVDIIATATDATNGTSEFTQCWGPLVLAPGAPDAYFTVSDSNICVGSCVDFSDLSTNTPTTWNWVFTGATPGTSNIANPTNICYNAPGTFTVKLTVSNLNGTDSLTKISYIVVTAIPSVNINPTADTVCPGDSVLLTANGATTYIWSPPSGLSATTGTSVMAGPSGTTTYTVTGSNGGCTASSTSVVSVSILPVVTVSPSSTTICSGTSDTLVASGATTYSWSPATGLNTTTGPTVIANPSGTTTYTVTGTSAGCSSSITVTVNVTSAIVADAGNNVSICAGDSTQLTASGGTSYNWSPTTGLSCSNCQSPMASPSSTMIYTVTVSSGSCIPATDAVTVTIKPLPLASISGDTLVCAGTLTTLTASGGTSYLWNTGGTTASINVSPLLPVVISVTVTSNGCSDTAAIQINVLDPEQVNAFPDTTINIGGSVQIYTDGGISWSWSPANGLSCADCSNPIASPEITTTYTVSAIDSNGCESSDYITITIVMDCGAVYIPNIFSPNGDNVNDLLYVRGNCIKSMEFIIYDRWGEKVFTTSNTEEGWDGSFRGQSVETGVYYYNLKSTLYDESSIKRKGSITLIR
jgi:gliding motility-associated-like protein